MPRKYAGETDSKRIVRAEFWLDVKRALGPQGWSQARIAVLSGPTGGDISTLLGLGADPSRIWAIDCDKAASGSARRLFPEVNHHHGYIEELAQSNPFDVIHMDVCGNGGTEDIKAFAAAAKALPDNGLLGVGMMYGREVDQRLKFMEENLELVISMAEQTAQGTIAPYFDAKDSHRLKMFMARHLYYRRKIMDFTVPSGTLLQAERTYFYKGNSTPMLYQLSRVVRTEARRKSFDAMFNEFCRRLPPEPRSFFIVRSSESSEQLRANVVSFDGTYKEAAMVYNVAARTVAAWKAHATMRSAPIGTRK